MVRLLKQIMTEILLDHPEAIVKDCFTRIAQLDKLKPLHEGLRLFLRHFLTRWKKAEPKNPLLLERIELVDTVLSRGKGHVLL
ncbi:hypothetical protein DPMN_194574 [Dreissena polymorpha]|uniref:Uncharacterized protein n=2 Tax=Dreissena polymorpha TaxID=45954 RepID=A0A9D3Y6F0_DREPO|nr:hypothetical protein DPMN_194574 [Dreissena polymorpha]